MRHVQFVGRRDVTSPIASVVNAGLGVGKEPLGVLLPGEAGVGWFDGCIIMSGQALHLLGIENRVSLHEGDFALLRLALVVRLGLGEGVGVNDKRAMLALADLPAQLLGLLVGEPQGADIAFFHCCRPKHEDVHATVWHPLRSQRS